MNMKPKGKIMNYQDLLDAIFTSACDSEAKTEKCAGIDVAIGNSRHVYDHNGEENRFASFREARKAERRYWNGHKVLDDYQLIQHHSTRSTVYADMAGNFMKPGHSEVYARIESGHIASSQAYITFSLRKN